jgi:hypothetical protein
VEELAFAVRDHECRPFPHPFLSLRGRRVELEHSIERRDFVVWAESLQWMGKERSHLPGDSLYKMVIAKLENKL